MAKIILPSSLTRVTAGEKVFVTGASVLGAALTELLVAYPELKPYLYAHNGALAPYLSMFINGTDMRDLEGIDTELKAEDEVSLILATAGG